MQERNKTTKMPRHVDASRTCPLLAFGIIFVLLVGSSFNFSDTYVKEKYERMSNPSIIIKGKVSREDSHMFRFVSKCLLPRVLDNFS